MINFLKRIGLYCQFKGHEWIPNTQSTFYTHWCSRCLAKKGGMHGDML